MGSADGTVHVLVFRNIWYTELNSLLFVYKKGEFPLDPRSFRGSRIVPTGGPSIEAHDPQELPASNLAHRYPLIYT